MYEYMAMWQNYANFNDRTTVRGYWMAVLFNMIAVFIIGVVSAILDFQWLYTLYVVAVFIPGLALSVRRLRDAGKAWPWIFISLVPVIGGIWMIILLVQPSAPMDGTPVV